MLLAAIGIDGAKALRKAIRRTFGKRTPFSAARSTRDATSWNGCPSTWYASVRRTLRQAWELDDADKAEKLIRNLTRRLEQVVPGVWSITMRNLTSGQSFSTLMAYLSTMLTVEWIEEAPLIISGSQGAYIATLPRLSTVQFSDVTANGIRSGTTPLDGIEMVSPKGTLEAVPSSPVGNGVEFNVCTYTARCPAP